ncbi:IS5 family transposase [Streptomyces sp. NPDC006990]|uniref:IS5 family transposase n=1 Tax=unclassified Streptomyces TaxID=2593676 RepID=UPI003456D52D
MGRAQGYPSDLTDEQWDLIAPLLPPPRTGPNAGRPEKHPRRRLVEAILYVTRTGCPWRYLPKDFPPWETVYWYFTRWHDDGTATRLHDALRRKVRTREGREPEPSAGLLDSQSVQNTDTVPTSTSGYDAGKRTRGRKRFIVTDTLGLLLVILVTSASLQDRNGGRRALLHTHHDAPATRHFWADAGFSGQCVTWVKDILGRSLEIVRKPAGQRGFRPLPRRWAVERTFAWISAHRRLTRDYERDPAHSATLIRWAMIGVITRRLTRNGPTTRPGRQPLRRAR